MKTINIKNAKIDFLRMDNEKVCRFIIQDEDDNMHNYHFVVGFYNPFNDKEHSSIAYDMDNFCEPINLNIESYNYEKMLNYSRKCVG